MLEGDIHTLYLLGGMLAPPLLLVCAHVKTRFIPAGYRVLMVFLLLGVELGMLAWKDLPGLYWF